MTVEFHRKTNGNTSVIINGRCTGEIRQYGSRFRYRPHGASDLQLGPAHATLGLQAIAGRSAHRQGRLIMMPTAIPSPSRMLALLSGATLWHLPILPQPTIGPRTVQTARELGFDGTDPLDILSELARAGQHWAARMQRCQMPAGRTFYVQERARVTHWDAGGKQAVVLYESDGTRRVVTPGTDDLPEPYSLERKVWTPASMMPDWAARIVLDVQAVEIVRVRDSVLQSIDRAKQENPLLARVPDSQLVDLLGQLWQADYGRTARELDFNRNPYCWAVEFTQRPITTSDIHHTTEESAL